MNAKILLSFGILLASVMAVATNGQSPFELLAQVSSGASAGAVSAPIYTIIQPREIRQGGNYAFTARITKAKFNADVVFYLQRPDATLKYGPEDDVLARIANRKTNRQGNWISPQIAQVIDSAAPIGVYTSWVTVAGIESNRVTHEVLPPKAELTAFEGEVGPNGVAALGIKAANVSQFKLRLTCPSGISAKNVNESSGSDLCNIEQTFPGNLAGLSLELKNESRTAKQVTARLAAVDEKNKVVGIKILRLRVLALGASPVSPVVPPIAASTSPSTIGNLLVALDVSTPSGRLVAGGATDIPLTVLKLTAIGEEIKMQSLTLQLDASNPAAVAKVSVWDGSAKVAEGFFSNQGLPSQVFRITPVIIPRDGDKLLTIKADIAEVGTSRPARAGDTVAVNFDADSPSTRGIGQTSSSTVVRSSELRDTTAARVWVFKSYPTLARHSVPTNTPSNGTMALYRFSVSAPAAGDVSLGKVTFGIQSSLVQISHPALYAYSDSGYSIQAYNANPLNFPLSSGVLATTSEVEIYFNPVAQVQNVKEAVVIPAGTTRYFELRATVSQLQRNAGGGFAVALLGDADTVPVTQLYRVNQSEHNNFIWSGNSTTTGAYHTNWNDWTSGYALPGLPAGQMERQLFGFLEIPPPSSAVSTTTFQIIPPAQELNLGMGATSTKLAALFDPDGPAGFQPEQNVAAFSQWSSSNTNIATVNNTTNKGFIIGRNSGSAAIAAAYTTASGATFYAMANVQVIAVTSSIPLSVDLKVNGSDGPVTVSYSASGINARLAWTSTGAASCTRNWGSPLRPSVEPSGTFDAGSFLSEGYSRTYTFTCVDAAGNSVGDSVAVTARLSAALNVSLNASSPRSAVVNPGQSGVTFAQIKLDAEGRAIGLRRVKIVSDSAGAIDALRNIQLTGSGGVVWTAETPALVADGGGAIQWFNVPSFEIPPGYAKTLTVKADIAAGARGSLRLGVSAVEGGTTGSPIVNAEVTIPGGVVYGNLMTVRDETVRDPLTFSAPETEIASGYVTRLAISADATRVSRLQLALRCSRNVNAPGTEGEQCGKTQQLAPTLDGYSIKFLNRTNAPQSVIATLRGYNSEGRLIATRLLTIRVKPIEEITPESTASSTTPADVSPPGGGARGDSSAGTSEAADDRQLVASAIQAVLEQAKNFLAQVSPGLLNAETVNAAAAPPRYQVVQPLELRRGKSYVFRGFVSKAAPNAPVIFFLRRPDGTLKYGDQNDALSSLAQRSADRYGNWNSPNILKMIDADAPVGVYTSWVKVGGVESNQVTHKVVPASARFTAFSAEPAQIASGETSDLTISGTELGELTLRAICPLGVSVFLPSSPEENICDVDKVIPGNITVKISNSNATNRQVTLRLIAYRLGDQQIAGVKTQRIRVSPAPLPETSLNIALDDASTPTGYLVEGGRTDVVMAALRVSARGEDVNLQSLGLQLDATNRAAIVKATIWYGPSKIGEAVFANRDRAISTFSTPRLIHKDSNRTLLIKADIASVGNSQPARGGDKIAINFNPNNPDTRGVGASSGAVIRPNPGSAAASAAGVRVFKSVPTLARFPVPADTLPNGSMVLYRFSAAASPSGDVGLAKVTFRISPQNAEVGNLQVYGYSDPAFSVQAYYANPLNYGEVQLSGDRYGIFFNPLSQLAWTKEAIEIPAGTTRYLELRGAVVKGSGTSSLEVSLAGDDSEAPISGINSLASSNFLWSGNSTTTASVYHNDWVNGYLAPGLPSGGMQLQAFIAAGATPLVIAPPPATTTPPQTQATTTPPQVTITPPLATSTPATNDGEIVGPGLEYHRIIFQFKSDNMDTDFGSMARIKNALPKYVAYMNSVLAKNTIRRLVFDPETDIQVVPLDSPTIGRDTLNLPQNNFKIVALIRRSESLHENTSYGGSSSQLSNGDAAVGTFKWSRVVDPDALPLSAPANDRRTDSANYADQIRGILHEIAHVFGAGIGEYYSLGVVLDESGVEPVLHIGSSSGYDHFWQSRRKYSNDPLLGPGNNRTLGEFLSVMRYSTTTAAVMNGQYRGDDKTPLTVPSRLLSAKVRVVDKDTGAPLSGATVKVWKSDLSLSMATSTPVTQLLVDGVTDNAGTFVFDWGMSISHTAYRSQSNPDGSICWNCPITRVDIFSPIGKGLLRLIKAYKPGYEPTAQYSWFFDAQEAKLVRGEDEFVIAVPMGVIGSAAASSTNVTAPPVPVAPPTIAPWGIASANLKANNSDGPVTVTQGGNVTLSWTSSNATVCIASGGWSGSWAVAGSWRVSNITNAATYGITCSGELGSASDSVDVRISAAPAGIPAAPVATLLTLSLSSNTVSYNENVRLSIASAATRIESLELLFRCPSQISATTGSGEEVCDRVQPLANSATSYAAKFLNRASQPLSVIVDLKGFDGNRNLVASRFAVLSVRPVLQSFAVAPATVASGNSITFSIAGRGAAGYGLSITCPSGTAATLNGSSVCDAGQTLSSDTSSVSVTVTASSTQVMRATLTALSDSGETLASKSAAFTVTAPPAIPAVSKAARQYLASIAVILDEIQELLAALRFSN